MSVPEMRSRRPARRGLARARRTTLFINFYRYGERASSSLTAARGSCRPIAELIGPQLLQGANWESLARGNYQQIEATAWGLEFFLVDKADIWPLPIAHIHCSYHNGREVDMGLKGEP